MGILSSLTEKIMLGAIVALLTTNVGGCVIKNRELHKTQEQLAKSNDRVVKLDADVATLKGNVATVKAGLSECNASVANTASVANAVAAAGVKALEQVQEAGKVTVARRLREIDAMPKQTCEDAFKILKTH